MRRIFHKLKVSKRAALVAHLISARCDFGVTSAERLNSPLKALEIAGFCAWTLRSPRIQGVRRPSARSALICRASCRRGVLTISEMVRDRGRLPENGLYLVQAVARGCDRADG